MERGASLRVCIVALAVSLALSAGCAATPVVAPGLANVPAIPDLAVTPEIGVHDAIANGHDSCPRARVAAADPLRGRYPACPGVEATRLTAALVVVPTASQPEPSDELWNLHLRGLPPCESLRDAIASNEIALPLCR